MSSRRTRLRTAFAALLTLLVLGPTAILFDRTWRDNDQRRRTTTLERNGVEYLTAMTPLLDALAESQAAAIQGRSGPPASVPAAITRVAAVDSRLGDALGTKHRWAGLQDQIGRLAGTAADAAAAYQAHTEVTDLTLALYDAVRRNSGLSRDPDSDLSNLQAAVTVDMPSTFVQVSRMGDLSGILGKVTGTAKVALSVQFGQAVFAAQDSVNRLTADLQAAVDDTTSRTLSGNLVTTLDSFRRGVESMTQGANPGAAPDLATVTAAQSSLQSALTSLAGVLLDEMSRLLDARTSALASRRTETVALGALTIFLVLSSLILLTTGRRRKDRPPLADVGDTSDAPDETARHGEIDATRRERSGALR